MSNLSSERFKSSFIFNKQLNGSAISLRNIIFFSNLVVDKIKLSCPSFTKLARRYRNVLPKVQRWKIVQAFCTEKIQACAEKIKWLKDGKCSNFLIFHIFIYIFLLYIVYICTFWYTYFPSFWITIHLYFPI